MQNSAVLPVKRFAKIVQMPASTLRYYDSIGVLPAAIRGFNSYRYYSIKQIPTINAICILQDCGVSLEAIKSILTRRSPELMLSLLKKQIENIDCDIIELKKKKEFLSGIYNIIYPSLDINEDAICIQQLGEARIIRGDLNNYEKKNDFSVLSKFYEYIKINYPDLYFHYPIWGIFSEKRIKMRDWRWPDRYYICSNLGHDIRKKSLYAVGHIRCSYGEGGELYEKMLLYIENNGLELCGDVYEEYPLNELCTANEQEYLMRLLMPVRKK